MHTQRLLASLLVCLGLLSSGTAMSETIQVSIDGKSYPVEMADNADARAFIARLPMTLTLKTSVAMNVSHIPSLLWNSNAPPATLRSRAER